MSGFELIILIGLASIPIALVAVIGLARGFHILLAFVIGAILWFPGSMLGVAIFCSGDAGNLCGLAAAFGTGPLALSVGASAYALLCRLKIIT